MSYRPIPRPWGNRPPGRGQPGRGYAPLASAITRAAGQIRENKLFPKLFSVRDDDSTALLVRYGTIPVPSRKPLSADASPPKSTQPPPGISSHNKQGSKCGRCSQQNCVDQSQALADSILVCISAPGALSYLTSIFIF